MLSPDDSSLSVSSIKEGLEKAGVNGNLDFGQLFQVVTAEEADGPKLRFDLVEFELRHLKEHVDKLKFNYLEMSTKREFMARLLDADEWGHLYQSTIWTPADMRALEKEGEGNKAALVAAKGRTSELEAELGRLTEHLCALSENVQDKMGAAEEMEEQARELEDEMEAVRPPASSIHPVPTRSVEELQGLLDDHLLSLEKRRAAAEARRATLKQLEAQLAAQHSELAALSNTDAELQGKLEERAKAEQQDDQQRAFYNKQQAGLVDWYRALLGLHSQLTGVKIIEMIRPGLLLLQLSPQPTVPSSNEAEEEHGCNDEIRLQVQVHVCQATGRLLDLAVSGASVPAWKEAADSAIATGNIGQFLRHLHSTLCNQ